VRLGAGAIGRRPNASKPVIIGQRCAWIYEGGHLRRANSRVAVAPDAKLGTSLRACAEETIDVGGELEQVDTLDDRHRQRHEEEENEGSKGEKRRKRGEEHGCLS
jgi:hypothetical protein